jgi:hypothetical protein
MQQIWVCATDGGVTRDVNTVITGTAMENNAHSSNRSLHNKQYHTSLYYGVIMRVVQNRGMYVCRCIFKASLCTYIVNVSLVFIDAWRRTYRTSTIVDRSQFQICVWRTYGHILRVASFICVFIRPIRIEPLVTRLLWLDSYLGLRVRSVGTDKQLECVRRCCLSDCNALQNQPHGQLLHQSNTRANSLLPWVYAETRLDLSVVLVGRETLLLSKLQRQTE